MKFSEHVVVERASEVDLEQILIIQREAYQSEAVLYSDFSIPPLCETLGELRNEYCEKTILKAVREGRLVGSVRVSLIGDICQVGRLIVTPEVQNQGIGTALLLAAETVYPNARVMELFTGSRSTQNLVFYRKRGYVPTREQVLSPKVTLVFLQKPLSRLRCTARPC